KPVALDATTMKQIQDLTREAMGFSQQRGDTLAVVNSAFSASANAPDQEPWWRQFDWFSLLGTLGRYLLVLIAAIVLYRMVLKPLRQRYLASALVAPAVKSVGKAGAEAASEEVSAPRKSQRKASSYEHSLQELKGLAKDDPATVATIVRNWVKREGQEVTQEMARLDNISHEDMRQVLDDFQDEAEQYAALSVNSTEHIRAVLERALGAERAATLLDDILESNGAHSGIDALNLMEASAVSEMIREEHPQIIATILVHLERRQAADVLGTFEEKLRNDVVLRIATFSGVQPAALQELTEVLGN